MTYGADFAIPDQIWASLKGGYVWGGAWRLYPTESAALDALAVAVAAVLKEKAGVK